MRAAVFLLVCVVADCSATDDPVAVRAAGVSRMLKAAAEAIVCNKTVTLPAGQDCCGVAELNGISFNDFLTLNPLLDCDKPTAGASVCVQSAELCIPANVCDTAGPITVKLAKWKRSGLYEGIRRGWASKALVGETTAAPLTTDTTATKDSWGWICDYNYYECTYFYNSNLRNLSYRGDQYDGNSTGRDWCCDSFDCWWCRESTTKVKAGRSADTNRDWCWDGWDWYWCRSGLGVGKTVGTNRFWCWDGWDWYWCRSGAAKEGKVVVTNKDWCWDGWDWYYCRSANSTATKVVGSNRDYCWDGWDWYSCAKKEGVSRDWCYDIWWGWYACRSGVAKGVTKGLGRTDWCWDSWWGEWYVCRSTVVDGKVVGKAEDVATEKLWCWDWFWLEYYWC